MNSTKKEDLSKYQQVILQSDDPRLNYTVMKKKDIDAFNEQPDILHSDAIDYGIKIADGDDYRLDQHVPISLLGIKTLGDAELWYKEKYPNLPDEYHGIMAKYHCDQPFTKKQLRNEVKKLNKKGKSKALEGLKIVHQTVKIGFD
tara:strand:- start:3293 stop:3727 length:435 start_codon:yes stop_codon:yes gene_type:complete